LIGEVTAAGKTIDQLKNELTAILAKFVPDPVVTVSISQVLGNKIYIIGKVSRPGEIVTNRNIDVMQALSIAGGPTPFASVNKIKILRRGENGETTTIPFKYSRVEKGKDLEQNIILRGGDIVVVP
jgi:polysaccharide export outer membrane protein